MMADLRFAAWFLWMTPFETALSSLREATRLASSAASLFPASAASRNLRTSVFSSDFTALLRWCRFSLCLIRLIWDLMFATDKAFVSSGALVRVWGAASGRTHEARTYQRGADLPNSQQGPIRSKDSLRATWALIPDRGLG